jgi:hypothetical protein
MTPDPPQRRPRGPLTPAPVLLPPSTTIPLGQAWARNGVNAMTYRQHGLCSLAAVQAGSFFAADGALVVFRRNLATDALERTEIRDLPLPLDAHHSPSVGIDAAGRLHVAGGTHVSAGFAMRTAPGGALDTLSVVADEGLRAAGAISYPSFFSGVEDSFHMAYRVGVPGRGAWHALRWDEAAGGWHPTYLPIASGILPQSWSASPYVNNVLRAHAGRVGMFLVWRSEALAGSRQTVRNIGIDYIEFDPAAGRAYTHAGLPLPVPVTPAVTERVVAVPWHAGLSNQSGATRLPDGRPFGTALFGAGTRPRQVRVFWPNANLVWRDRALTRFATPSDMRGRGSLYQPHSRPACAALPDGRVVVLFRTVEYGNRLVAAVLPPPDFDPRQMACFTLWDEDLGFYEPVIDIGLAETTGRLVAQVQRCGAAPDQRHGNDAPPAEDDPGAAIHLVEWRLP